MKYKRKILLGGLLLLFGVLFYLFYTDNPIILSLIKSEASSYTVTCRDSEGRAPDYTKTGVVTYTFKQGNKEARYVVDERWFMAIQGTYNNDQSACDGRSSGKYMVGFDFTCNRGSNDADAIELGVSQHIGYHKRNMVYELTSKYNHPSAEVRAIITIPDLKRLLINYIRDSYNPSYPEYGLYNMKFEDCFPVNGCAKCSTQFSNRGHFDSCMDNTIDGNETDVDCGGDAIALPTDRGIWGHIPLSVPRTSIFCNRCTTGKACLKNSDCASGACGTNGRCAAR